MSVKETTADKEEVVREGSWKPLSYHTAGLLPLAVIQGKGPKAANALAGATPAPRRVTASLCERA